MLYAQRLAADPDSIMERKRTLYDIAMVPLTEVEAIANGSLCAKAGREYKKALGLSGPAPDVELVRIGERYIAVNHSINEPGSEFTLYLVLNAQMKEVAGFAA